MINPAFAPYPEEASLIGSMVVGYGELDISFAMVCGIILNHQFAVLAACHSVRSESARIDIADALAREAFESSPFSKEYEQTLQAMRFCLKVRNLYAHSQWADEAGSLCHTDPDGAFKRPIKRISWTPIDLGLLKAQESFFENTRAWLIWLELSLRESGKKNPNSWSRPPKMQQPRLDNRARKPHDRTAPSSPHTPKAPPRS